MTTEADYPEHEKLKDLNGANQVVGNFINWLGENGYEIAKWHPHRDELVPANRSIEKWIAEHFEIDAVKLENEKLAILDAIRTANDRAAS